MIGEICTKPVVTVSPKTSILDAARLMRQRGVGALVVANSRTPQGILTDRDVAVGVVAQGRDPATTTVAEVMRRDPTVIREDKGVFDAVRLFDLKGVRRLPVVSRAGKLTGIVAMDDLLMLFGREMGHLASALSRGLKRPLARAS